MYHVAIEGVSGLQCPLPYEMKLIYFLAATMCYAFTLHLLTSGYFSPGIPVFFVVFFFLLVLNVFTYIFSQIERTLLLTASFYLQSVEAFCLTSIEVVAAPPILELSTNLINVLFTPSTR